ncbi:MAG: flagellar protein FliS [Lachnospiraceae bacterium]|nr:flagellar protein FliS [Lachnospiraceae bacterium]
MNEQKKVEFGRRVAQANPTQLVVITFDIALTYLEDAEDALPKASEEQAQAKESSFALKKLRESILNLQNALDFQYEVAKSFLSLYSYVLREVARAEAKRDAAPLANVKLVLSSLRNSFEEIESQDKREPLMENAQSVYVGLTYRRGNLEETIPPDANRGYLA